jgi:hypothetical protein
MITERSVFYFNTKTSLSKHREGYSAKRWRDAWIEIDPTSLNTSDIKYYVVLKRGAPQYSRIEKDLFTFAEDFKKFIINVQRAGVFDITEEDRIYGIPANSYRISQRGWRDFPTYVFSKLKEVMTPEKEEELSLAISPLSTYGYDDLLEKIAKEEPLDFNSEMQKFCNSLYAAKEKLDFSTEALAGVIEKAAALNQYQIKNVIDFPGMWIQIQGKYPLLGRYGLGKYGDDKTDNHMIDYLRFVDITRETPERGHQLLDEIYVSQVTRRLDR